MMILTTVSQHTTAGNICVYWRVGSRRNGILRVTNVPAVINEADHLAVAEICAIRHLCFEKEVFGQPLLSGHGVTFSVSLGAIKKAALGHTTKFSLKPYALYFHEALRGASFSVSKSMDFMATESDDVEVLEVDESFLDPRGLIDTPAMGKLKITKHAVDQYLDRISTGRPQNPRASLIGRLRHPELSQSPLPASVAAHKAKKYGDANNIEVWGHASSPFKFLVVREDLASGTERTLVTVFERSEPLPPMKH